MVLKNLDNVFAIMKESELIEAERNRIKINGWASYNINAEVKYQFFWPIVNGVIQKVCFDGQYLSDMLKILDIMKREYELTLNQEEEPKLIVELKKLLSEKEQRFIVLMPRVEEMIW